MAHLFREKNVGLSVDHELIEGSHVVSFSTKKATIDIVHSKRYGPLFYIDGVLQAAHFDEYIYHEFLVHPALANSQSVKKICVFGGSDGCAIREICKWKEVQQVTVMDWDEELVHYFQANGKLWHQGAWNDNRVYFDCKDVLKLADEQQVSKYDVLLIDLLDPEYKDLEEGGFWDKVLQLAKDMRNPGGSIVINTGGVVPWRYSNFYTLFKKALALFRASNVVPYKVFVPSFQEEWSYILIHDQPQIQTSFPPFTRRLTETTFLKATVWEKEYQKN